MAPKWTAALAIPVAARSCPHAERLKTPRDTPQVEQGDSGFHPRALVGHARTGRYYFPLGEVGDREAVANLSQARLFDTKRLIRKIGMLDERTYRELARALALTLFPFLSLK